MLRSWHKRFCIDFYHVEVKCKAKFYAMGKLKCFEIVFDGNKTVFHPGERVTGQCVVELKGDMKMRALRVFMRGVAKVHWTESRSTGTRLGSYTEHYNAELEYFFKRQVLFGGGRYWLSVVQVCDLLNMCGASTADSCQTWHDLWCMHVESTCATMTQLIML